MWATKTYTDEPDMVKDAAIGDGDHEDPKVFRKMGMAVSLWKPLLAVLESTVIWCENHCIKMT